MVKPIKLKSSYGELIIISLIIALIIIGARIFIGREVSHIMVSIIVFIFALIHFFTLLRTKNKNYLITTLFYLFMTPFFLTVDNSPWEAIFASLSGIFFILFMYLLITRKIKWRYTEILELAARPVNEADNGFTARPFPAGEAKYTREEINGFAKFLLQQTIAFPYFEESRIVLVVPANMFKHILFFKRDYEREIYVAFDFEGNISVNIPKKDYRKFKEELTFDQLCRSLGNLFREFLAQYQKGEKGRIIERLNALRFAV